PHALRGPAPFLVGPRGGEEAILDQVLAGLLVGVVLHRGLYAVVIGDDQAIGRYERRRATGHRDHRGQRRRQWIGARLGVELDADVADRLDGERQGHLLRQPHPAWIGILQPEPEGGIGLGLRRRAWLTRCGRAGGGERLSGARTLRSATTSCEDE